MLFLADRNILANQAYNAFSVFEDRIPGSLVRIAPDEIAKKGKVPQNGSVFFTIFQTFMSGPPKDGAPSPYFGQYPADFFDFIIIDECPRGGATDESAWRDILTYFAPAVQLGLTATPKRKDNVDTYAYFGEPVYSYSLKDGINDGFLTLFRVVQIDTTLDEYIYTPGDSVLAGEIQPGKRYEEKDFNRVIEITERERSRVRILLDHLNPTEKTLIFCAEQPHPLIIRDLINQMKDSSDPNYCHRVTSDDGSLGEQHLRDFQDNEKTIPTILTTSRKLSTGVDARNVRNIALMRPVTSMIEFKQIIGRGTRLYDGKDYFTIYDFVKAYRLFSDPAWDGDPDPDLGPPPFAPSTPISSPMEQPGISDGHRPSYQKPQRIKIRLGDGRERTIQHMTATSFWHPDGTPMSSQQFLEMLFGKLPAFFKSEEELRALWSEPDTRKKLLDRLAEQRFGKGELAAMQNLIEAENSDLFDVLAYVAYATEPLTREERAARAKIVFHTRFTDKQQIFIDFVLSHYIRAGVEELDPNKLNPLLRLKYNDSLADAVHELGPAQDIGKTFREFQRYLYVKDAVA